MEETNSTKILVVVDLQNDFVTGALGTQEAQAIVPRVCEKIRNFPGPVYYTQDTHGEDYFQTQEGQIPASGALHPGDVGVADGASDRGPAEEYPH